MDRSQLLRSRLGAAGFAGGEASRCEPASCCEPAALSCWQIAEWLVGGQNYSDCTLTPGGVRKDFLTPPAHAQHSVLSLIRGSKELPYSPWSHLSSPNNAGNIDVKHDSAIAIEPVLAIQHL